MKDGALFGIFIALVWIAAALMNVVHALEKLAKP